MTRGPAAPILCDIIVKRYSSKSFARKFQRKPHIAYHAPRYAALLDLLSRHRPAAAAAGEPRILDVGRSPLTEILYDELMMPVDSLGAVDADQGFGRQYRFDLADAARRQRWRSDLPAYDVVVAAQAYDYPPDVAPRDVLAFLASLLKSGGLLVVQTPNPRALHHRARSLLGTRPRDRRGYDRRALREAADALGLQTVECSFTRAFDYRCHRKSRQRRWVGTAANLLFRVAPPGLKPGLTVAFRKDPQPSSQPS